MAGAGHATAELPEKLRQHLARLQATSRVTNNSTESELRRNVNGVKEGVAELCRELREAKASAREAEASARQAGQANTARRRAASSTT